MLNELLLIPDKSDTERDALAKVWEQHGGIVKRIGPFWIKPDTENRRVSIYGNDTFALVLAQLLRIELLMPDDALIAELSLRWVKRKMEIVRVSAVHEIAYPKFIKPVQPKLFMAGIYHEPDELHSQLQQVKENERLICSEIVKVEKEVRAFVLNSEVKDLAFYEGSGDTAEPKSFIADFLRENAAKLPKTFVVDAGYNEQSGWFIIEFNSSWGAGLNGCNAEKVVECIREAAIHE